MVARVWWQVLIFEVFMSISHSLMLKLMSTLYDIHVIISIQYLPVAGFSHRNTNWFYCELILFYTNNVVFQSLSIGGLDLSLPWDSTKTLAFMNAQTSFYDTSGFSSYPHFLSVSVFQILNINQYCSFLHGVLEKR